MADLNNVTLSGRIVDDFSLRKTNKGGSVLNFRLLHTAPRQRTPLYIDVEVWGKEAETLAENAKRGTNVVVHAEIRRDRWETDEGVRSKIKLTAERVMVDASPSKTADGPSF